MNEMFKLCWKNISISSETIMPAGVMNRIFIRYFERQNTLNISRETQTHTQIEKKRKSFVFWNENGLSSKRLSGK